MGEPTIRVATTDDLPRLLDIEQCIIEAERPFNDRMKDGHTHYYDLDELLEDDDCRIAVAETDDRIVASGFARLRDSEQYLAHDRHAYLGFMYVEPRHRGRGINRAIIAELVEWSRSRGVRDVYLDVYEGNRAAMRAYEKAGFGRSVVEMRLSLTG